MKRRLLIFVIVIAVLLPAAVLITGSLLTRPVNQSIGELPADFAAKQVEFSGSSGTIIRGWFVQGKENFGAVILMHGVRANRLSMLERARCLSRAGYSVLLFDFQAHGESTGEQITFGYLESRDARAAVDFVRALLPKEKIGVIGVSMGGAAFLLADPKLEVDAVVLEMVYPAIEQAVSNRLTARLGGWATILTPLLTWQLKPRLGISAAELRPVDHVSTVTSPKLFIAGADDQHTTLAESKELFAAANDPKELWIVPDVGHVDLYAAAKEEYEQRVNLFFEKHLRQAVPKS
jgi:uncharacterized protein